MARYVVRFMKDVLGENGHEAEICQSSMEIDAANKLQASDLAKVKFCENESVKEWSLHADRVHVTRDVERALGQARQQAVIAGKRRVQGGIIRQHAEDDALAGARFLGRLGELGARRERPAGSGLHLIEGNEIPPGAKAYRIVR